MMPFRVSKFLLVHPISLNPLNRRYAGLAFNTTSSTSPSKEIEGIEAIQRNQKDNHDSESATQDLRKELDEAFKRADTLDLNKTAATSTTTAPLQLINNKLDSSKRYISLYCIN